MRRFHRLIHILAVPIALAAASMTAAASWAPVSTADTIAPRSTIDRTFFISPPLRCVAPILRPLHPKR